MAKKFPRLFRIAAITLLAVAFLSGFSKADDQEDELFFVAQKAFEDGFYDVALRYLDKFFKDFPQTSRRPQVSLLIGQCYFFENQYLKAFDVFQSLLNSPDSDGIKDAVFFWMGETYLKGKDYKQAENFYQQLISEFPKSTYLPQAYYSLGWTFFEEGAFQQSLDALARLVNNFKHHNLVEDATFKIGECRYNLKEYDKSKEQFTAYINTYPHSPRLDAAYFYIAESDYYLENLKFALDGYAKVISVASDDKIKALAKTSSGWALLKLKRCDDALKSFEDAEAICREKGLDADDILLGKGNLFAEQDQYGLALNSYEELIKSFPRSSRLADAYLGRANALYGLGKYLESAASYRTILDREADFKNSDLKEKAYFGLAWANLKLGNSAEAIENFKLVANSSGDKLMRLSAFCQMADAYQDTGNLSQALDIYDKILKDYPDSPYSDYVQYQEGMALLKMDKIDAATLMFQSLKANFPKSKFIPDAQYYLGTAYFKKGDFNSCIEQFGSLIKTMPLESELRSEAMFNLGLAYVHLEKYREAVEVFERVAKEYPLNNDLIQRSEFEIANIMFNQSKVKDALKKFKIIIYKYPSTQTSLQALSWLGDYYLKDKQFDTATKYFRQIIEDFPDSNLVNEAGYNLGKALLEMGRFNDAMKEFDRVSPQSERKLLAQTKLAQAAISFKTNARESVSSYERIIKDYPDYARSAFIELAQVYKSLNESDKAIAALQSSLNIPADGLSEVTDAQIQFDIADLEEANGDLNLAIEAYLKIPYLYSQQSSLVVKSYLRLGRIFEDKNDWKEAKKIYEKIASQNIEEAKFAQERLEWINRNLKN